MHTNVQLKTRSYTRVRVFYLTKTYLYPSSVIWDSCLYHILSHRYTSHTVSHTVSHKSCGNGGKVTFDKQRGLGI